MTPSKFIESRRVEGAPDLEAHVKEFLNAKFEEECRAAGLKQVCDWLVIIEKGTWVGEGYVKDLELLLASPAMAWVDGENAAYLELMYGDGDSNFAGFLQTN